jgi:predicted PhzF superfamily epimerase YddE/YHI9
VTADVFTGRQFGGNPLAVVLDGRGLSAELMLAVTREFNYSETTFVLPPERGGAARVRIFTPGGEVPFAGHPTVGTAHVLFATGALAAEADEATVVLEEAVGDVPVRVRFAGAPGDAAAGPALGCRSTRPTCSAATTRRASGRAGCRSRSWPCATARRWAGRACGPTPGSAPSPPPSGGAA